MCVRCRRHAGCSPSSLLGQRAACRPRGKRAVGRRARAVRADAAGGAAPASRGGAQALPDDRRARYTAPVGPVPSTRKARSGRWPATRSAARTRCWIAPSLGVAVFVLLLTTASTFLYFEQARLVVELFPDRVGQVRVFGAIDFVVQAGRCCRSCSSPGALPSVWACARLPGRAGAGLFGLSGWRWRRPSPCWRR